MSIQVRLIGFGRFMELFELFLELIDDGGIALMPDTPWGEFKIRTAIEKRSRKRMRTASSVAYQKIAVLKLFED